MANLLILIALCLTGLCATCQTLNLPIRSGKIMGADSVSLYHTSGSIVVISSTDSVVVSMEKSVVKEIYSMEGVRIVVLHGNYQISYGDFLELFVRKGQSLNVGEPIGVLAKNMDGLLLEILVERNGKKVERKEVTKHWNLKNN